MKTKLNKKMIVLIIIAAAVLVSALTIGIIILSYNAQCNKITGNERKVIELCEDNGIMNVKYANFLESSHNGYREYSYYDVVTDNGNHYIVEVAENGNSPEYIGKTSYSGFFNRSTILKDVIEYRSSKNGQYSDSVNAILYN